MYKLLLRITATLLIIFTMIIGLISYAGSTATPQHLFPFDPPDCYLPCVFGITSGKTTWDEYQALVAAKVPATQQTWGQLSDFWLTDANGSKIELFGDHFFGAITKRRL